MVALPSNGPGRAPRALAILPARLDSTRLPRKMLLRETGRYLFEYAVENARAAELFERVVLATDADEIRDAAEALGIEARLTSPAHPSGTDRVCEAFEALAREGLVVDVVVNLQGDEPELPATTMSELLAAFRDPAVELATLVHRLEVAEVANDPAVVKVVCDASGDALYFSRAPIPHLRDAGTAPERRAPLFRHVGVYAFRPDALRAFCALGPSPLERTEALEQLRWLEAGRRIRCIEVPPHPPGIDTREQYQAFRDRLATRPTTESKATS